MSIQVMLTDFSPEIKISVEKISQKLCESAIMHTGFAYQETIYNMCNDSEYFCWVMLSYVPLILCIA